MIKHKHIKQNQLNRKIIFLLGSLCVLFSSFSYSQVQGVSYSVGKVVTGDAATTYTVPYTITPADTVGSTFTANTTGGGTITLSNGQILTVSNLPTTVQDAAGTVYQADDKGKLTKVGTSSSNAGAMLATANLTVVDASKGTVTFAPTSNMKYAFDAWQKAYDGNSAWSKRYETLPLSGGAKGGAYRVSSKLMVPGEADKVLAIINLNDKSIAAGSVQFVNAKGTVFEKDSITPTSYKINLVGGPAGDAQEVYALYSTGGKTYTLGKLLVATYEPKTINLALVPVNDAPLDSKAIAAELKKIYEPLGIDFNLITKDNFKYKALETASLKVEGSGLLSVYTDQMKALNAAFVAKGDCDKNTIYLFAIDQPESQDGKSIEGVMARGQQFGYMFVKGKEGDEQGLTAAHEIGHGIFQLQHAFEYSGIKQKAISPLNVMDYPVGEALSKLQWDLMHDQGLVISVFETDKGVESSIYTSDIINKATELTKKMGNVYAIIHAFKTDKKVLKKSETIKQTSTDAVRVPTEFITVYSESAQVQINVLFYTLKDNTSTISNNPFDLPKDLKEKLSQVNNNLIAPYLAVVEPGRYRDCTNYIGSLDAEAKDALAGEKVSEYYNDLLKAIVKCTNKHTLLFVNGYRFATSINEKEHNPTIFTSDIVDDGKSYWSGIDQEFIPRLNSSSVFYADGHMSIETSNHLNIPNFYCSAKNMIATFPPTFKEAALKYADKALCIIPKVGVELKLALDIACNGTGLNTAPNRSGFDKRKAEGRNGGDKLYKEMIANKTIFKNSQGMIADTLDIVCHSMGYAYALGMIDYLKGKVPFGRFYIIAPENAESGGTDWTMFTEVWQYGSDEKQLKDKPWLQDGVAPQVSVPDIDNKGKNPKGGRAYIPINLDGVPQGFISSHSIENYKWIFTRQINQPGYVTPRK